MVSNSHAEVLLGGRADPARRRRSITVWAGKVSPDGLPARRSRHAVVHAAASTAVTVGVAAVIATVLGVAGWMATLIVVGVIAVVVVVAAAYVLSRP